MSVRKSASRSGRDYSAGTNALKSLGVWALLAGASFIVGLFILSPLINVAAGSRNPETTPKSQPVPTASTVPAQHEEAPPVRKPVERQADSDVELSVEKPHGETNSNVQQPSGVDDSSNTNVRDENSHSNRDSNSDESVSRTPDTETQREGTTTRSRRRNTDSETPRTESSESSAPRDRSSNSEDPKPRRHRSRSSESSKSAGESSTPPDVQKGEGIDR